MRSFKVLSASCILVGFICFFLVMQKEKNQEYKDYKTNKDPEIFQDKSFLHKLSLLIYDVLTSQGGWQVWFLAHWRTIPINTYCPSIACPFLVLSRWSLFSCFFIFGDTSSLCWFIGRVWYVWGKMELFFVLSSLSKFSRFCSVSAATTVSPLQVMTIPQKMLLPKEWAVEAALAHSSQKKPEEILMIKRGASILFGEVIPASTVAVS